jgi:hypothetical protein
MRNIVGLIFITIVLTRALIANAAAVSGVVVDADTNLPVPWAYAQLHRYNPETGYLEFAASGQTAEDGSFFFKTEKEGDHLLEVSADSYLLSRVYTFLADDWDTTGLLVILTPSPAIINGVSTLVLEGDELVVNYQIKNTTAKSLPVWISLMVFAPADTDFQTMFEAGPWSLLVHALCTEAGEKRVSVSLSIPIGYSVCGWLQVTAPGNPFVVYDKLSVCTSPKGSALPTSPPTTVPPKG